MMRLLPDCPMCDENELWLSKHDTWIMVKCYLCGWNATIMPRPSEDALNAAIADIVAKAKPQAEAKDDHEAT